jgi:arylformamidase
MVSPSNRLISSKPVFLHYDQAALDAAYDQNVWARDREASWQRRALLSDQVKLRIGQPMRLAYGAAPVEQLDYYRADADAAPVVVIVHGGAWRRGTAAGHAFAAEPFISAGVHYIVPDFSNVQDVGGDLNVLVQQIRAVIAWTFRNVGQHGGDPRQIYLIGHSSGAHLIASALLADWPSQNLPVKPVKASFCLSGLYDLRGARLSARSNYVAFTDQIEQDFSPLRHVSRIPCPITLAYGTSDSPEFQRMAQEFALALRGVGKLTDLIVAEQMDHFETFECLADPLTPIGKAALDMIANGR